ncbi:MAG: peptidoglycan DD-metalloendopeptidase family protein, partial [Candidatus Marinimicrobia bacterium]|nr:peptidoglycan DD-metalloendopeptidase family protein [Candidatus Neomarinimicrobiota bacterium]
QRRRVRNKELGNLKRDRQKMSVALNQRKKAAQQMESIISRLERERVARIAELERKRKEMELLGSVPFKELKGKLPWPIEGKVISRFGTYQNPNLKTVTENTGIDIHGSEGTAVKSIYDGIVTTVTYIRGYGNTVILDHGDGFYSVYTHVTDVEVEENSYVNARDIIAHVGDSGSLEGTKLHFEIWGNKDKLNPELWLQKR